MRLQLNPFEWRFNRIRRIMFQHNYRHKNKEINGVKTIKRSIRIPTNIMNKVAKKSCLKIKKGKKTKKTIFRFF